MSKFDVNFEQFLMEFKKKINENRILTLATGNSHNVLQYNV